MKRSYVVYDGNIYKNPLKAEVAKNFKQSSELVENITRFTLTLMIWNKTLKVSANR